MVENNAQNLHFVFASHNTSSYTVMLKGGPGGRRPPEVGLKVAITAQAPNESLPSYFFRTATLVQGIVKVNNSYFLC